MSRLIRSFVAIALGIVMVLWTSCGGGSGGGSGLKLRSAVQNITVDPTGATLDLTFSQAVENGSAESSGSYSGSGGQRATSATLQGDGRTVRVVFDQPFLAGTSTLTIAGVRSVTGNGMLSKSGLKITSTDETSPTVGNLVAEAVAAASNDRIVVRFDEGMLEADVVDLARYHLENPTGQPLDITGSAIAWNPALFEVEIVLTNGGGDADNLQTGRPVQLRIDAGMRDVAGNELEETTLSGTVTGDQERPTVLAAIQNLNIDPQGQTVDVRFSEDIDVDSGETLAHYNASAGQGISTAAVSGRLARLRFGSTIVPGETSLDVRGVKDLAGNEMYAIAGLTVTGNDGTPPSLQAVVATTIANRGNDTFQVTFDEPVLRSDAEDVGRYVIQSPNGRTLDPNSMSASYDPATRTVTITLDGTGAQAVDLRTGDDFLCEVFSVRDVAGNALTYASASGTVGGDTIAPKLLSVTQDTELEPDGTILALEFSEDLAALPAFQPANFSVGDLATPILSSIHPGRPAVVLVQFDTVVLPGAYHLDVSQQQDLAGNTMDPVTGVAITAMEKQPPTLFAALAKAVAGARNDWILLTFDEPMYAPDVEDLTKYTFENPTGTFLALGNSTATYEPQLWSVRITLDEAGALADDLRAGTPLSVTVEGVRDVSGNPVNGTSRVTTTVSGDSQGPRFVVAWRNVGVDASGSTTDLVFDEGLDLPSAETLTNWTMVGGHVSPTSAVVLGKDDVVRVTWSAPIVPGTDRLAFQNLMDKAGNPALPRTGITILQNETTPPTTIGSTATTQAGIGGDGFEIVFDEDMHPGDVLTASNYQVLDGGVPVPTNVLTRALYEYEPETRSVRVTFDPATSYELTSGQGLTIDLLSMRDARGNVQASSTQTPTASGDQTPPAVTRVLLDGSALDALYVEFEEVIDPSSVDALDFVHATWNVLGVQVVEPRTVYVQLDGNPVPGVDTMDISGISDLAGNTMPGASTVAILGNDTQAPGISVEAEAVPGEANDVIRVTFSEPMNENLVLDRSRYAFESPLGNPVQMSATTFQWDAQTTTLTITLWQSQWLTRGGPFSMTVFGLEDVAGNPLSTTIAGTVQGDSDPPTLLWVDRNEIHDPTGHVVDLYFDETVDPAVVSQGIGFQISSGSSVVDASNLYDRRIVRVVFSAPVTPGSHTLTVRDQRDLAGNTMVQQSGVEIRP